VEYNQITVGSLGDVSAGDPFTWTFLVDSDDFLNSSFYNTRGYPIDLESFSATFGPSTLGFKDPFPGIPYFVLRESDPVADGFFMAQDNVDWPYPDCPLDEVGILGDFAVHFEVGYTGDTLATLDILDAVGTYDYTGLTSFYTVVMDGWAEPMGLEYGQLTISVVSAPALDIKPGSCPNSFNPRSKGVLPVALVGTDAFDVMDVDIASLMLSRADGVGGYAMPNEGPPGPHSTYGDTATPFDGELCDCHEMEGDGITDLNMKFKTQEVVAALELGTMMPGTEVELVVSGTLLVGTAFTASDCIAVVGMTQTRSKGIDRLDR
jgi:hypothetical protein